MLCCLCVGLVLGVCWSFVVIVGLIVIVCWGVVVFDDVYWF